MWGAGGLTWGLMIRYLGVGLGVAIGCGLCAAVGTLVPPLVQGDFLKLSATSQGTAALVALLAGVAVSLVGIVITGAAGMSKEREMSEEQKKAAVEEFDFTKGILVAVFSGVMSAGMSFGVRAADGVMTPLAKSVEPVTPALWTGLPGLVVILLGGFTVNFLWTLFLNFKNRTTTDYSKGGAPLAANYLFSALAGILWYSQMAFYTMGDSKIGAYKFSGWSVFMSAQIIFSTLWGIALLEWKGASPRTRKLLGAGLAVLVLSLVVIGYGNYLKPAG
jgi:L-rhamnose-H+ transport protein